MRAIRLYWQEFGWQQLPRRTASLMEHPRRWDAALFGALRGPPRTRAESTNSILKGRRSSMSVYYYLQIDGIMGPCRTPPYVGWIEVTSFEFVIQPAAHGAASPSKANVSSAQFTVESGSSTPNLAIAEATGRPIKRVVLSGGSGRDTLSVTFEDCCITDARRGGARISGPAHFQFTLAYSIIKKTWGVAPPHSIKWNAEGA